MKVRKRLLFLQMIGVALISTQYFMINALSGAVLNLVCLIRTIFFYFAEDKIKMKSVKFTDFLFSLLFWYAYLGCILGKGGTRYCYCFALRLILFVRVFAIHKTFAKVYC